MIARLLRSADFERVLRTRTRASSAHFAVHHLCDRPSVPAKRQEKPLQIELSTGENSVVTSAVDDSIAPSLPIAAGGVWLGAVVPKRHAKRSVTRTLLKRQIRCAIDSCETKLAGGLWVVRLRAPFDRSIFVSAASDALKRAARAELEQVLASAVQRVGGR